MRVKAISPGRLKKVVHWGKRKGRRVCDLSKCHKEAAGSGFQHFTLLLSPTTTTIISCSLFGTENRNLFSLPFSQPAMKIFHTLSPGSQSHPVPSVGIQARFSPGNHTVLPKSLPLVEDFSPLGLVVIRTLVLLFGLTNIYELPCATLYTYVCIYILRARFTTVKTVLSLLAGLSLSPTALGI